MPLNPTPVCPPRNRRSKLFEARFQICAWWSLALAALLCPLMQGCQVIKGVSQAPSRALQTVTTAKSEPPSLDPVALQQQLLRLADEFTYRATVAVNHLRRGTNKPTRAEVLHWKTALNSQTLSMVSGPNSVGNLLDMTVFVTMTRKGLEEYWGPKVFGASSEPLLLGLHDTETSLWDLTKRLLTPEQLSELRAAIEAWHHQNPLPQGVIEARATGLVWQLAQSSPTKSQKPGGVLDLLKLDPLSALDPATHEVALTRLFGERALYVSQKLPQLLRWQTELLSLDATDLPAIAQLVTNSTQLTASFERFTRTAEQLPAQLSAERQEIFKALQSQEQKLTPLATEVRQTLSTGSLMSASLNTTLTTFDLLMQRFGVGETNRFSSTTTNTEPFRIRDYGETALRLESAAGQLNELLLTFNQTLASTNLSRLAGQMTPALQAAQTSGKALVDHAFVKLLQLGLIGLAAALLYRLIGRRIGSNPSTPNKP